MMRQSPKPYAKEQGEADLPSSPVLGVLPRKGHLSTGSGVDYQKAGKNMGHLWGLSPTNHPFVPLAAWPVAIRYGPLSRPQHHST